MNIHIEELQKQKEELLQDKADNSKRLAEIKTIFQKNKVDAKILAERTTLIEDNHQIDSEIRKINSMIKLGSCILSEKERVMLPCVVNLVAAKISYGDERPILELARESIGEYEIIKGEVGLH